MTTTEEEIANQPWHIRALYHLGKFGEAVKEGVPDLVAEVDEKLEALAAWVQYVYEHATGDKDEEPQPGDDTQPDPDPDPAP